MSAILLSPFVWVSSLGVPFATSNEPTDTLRSLNSVYSTEEHRMSDVMSYLAIALAFAVIALDLLAIISVFKSDRTVGSKALWALGIALFPILGLVFWLIVGLRRKH